MISALSQTFSLAVTVTVERFLHSRGRNLLYTIGRVCVCVNSAVSMNPNIYVGRCEGSAIYLKWYYEAIIDHVETVSHLAPLIRIGWANTEGFVPYPGAGSNWGSNGVGDDLFSYGFDGVSLWTGELLRLLQLRVNDGSMGHMGHGSMHFYLWPTCIFTGSM